MTTRSMIAAILVFLQAALIALAGLALLAGSESRRRRVQRRLYHARALHHPGRIGLLLLLVALVLLVIGIGLYTKRAWAAISTYVAEAVVGLGGFIGYRPVRSLLGLAVAVAVVVLVATDRDRTAPPLRT